MTTTTIRRTRPARPVKQLPEELTKEASQETSLDLLREFYLEAKREIKKRETITLRKRTTEKYNSVSFLCDNFSLTIDFTEGFAV